MKNIVLALGIHVLSPVVQMADNTIQQINIKKRFCAIHWIKVYPVDSIINSSNNQGLFSNVMSLLRKSLSRNQQIRVFALYVQEADYFKSSVALRKSSKPKFLHLYVTREIAVGT